MATSDKALRAGLIRLAHAHPEFRKDLLPLIKEAADFAPDSIGDQVSGPTGVPGSDAKKPWAKGEFTQQEFTELDKKQEGGQLSDGKADPTSKKAASMPLDEMAYWLLKIQMASLDRHRVLSPSQVRAMGAPPAVVSAYEEKVSFFEENYEDEEMRLAALRTFVARHKR